MTPFRLRVLCLFGLLLALFMPQLAVLNVGFGDLESTFYLLGSLALALVLGGLFRTTVNFALVVGLLIYALIDIHLAAGIWQWVVLVAAVVGAGLLIRYRPVEVPLGVAVFALVFGAQYIFNPVQPVLETRAPTLPATASGQTNSYLHIILDEQMSPTVEGALILPVAGREEVVETYVSRDFQLYANATAPSHLTYESVSAIFGLGTGDGNFRLQEAGSPTKYTVSENILMDTLLAAGFAPTVIQSDYLDLCGDDGRVRCSTYALENDLQVGKAAGLSAMRRIGLSIVAMHSRFLDRTNEFVLYRQATAAFARLNGYRARWIRGFMRPVGALLMLDQVTEQVADMQPGDALIVHLMLPHFPYVLDRDCALRDREAWESQLPDNANATLESAYTAYWDQSICLHRRLGPLLDAAVAKGNMTVMIHGDHAARIVSGIRVGETADQLATMLAAYGPAVQAGLTTEEVPLQQAFTQEFAAFRDLAQPAQ